MQVGMTLPVMEPDLWEAGAATLESWARAVDEGAWSSLCWGERMAFDNPHSLTLLGAVAAWTSRVRLTATVVVPQLHDPVSLAKALATGDRLCGGRLSVGLGVGGRDEDYRAAGAPPATRTMAEMAARVAVMKRVWAGERVVESVLPVGPAPVRPGGPELLVGTLGPRTIRSAAAWADGLAGMSLDVDLSEMARLFSLTRSAWACAGRPPPRVTTSFWFALGPVDEARGQIRRHLRHYMNWIPGQHVDALAATAGFAGSVADLRDLLGRIEDLGCDEVQLIPTDSAVEQVHRLTDLR
ncbi:LLM class flavin-dependent oxidoreductase [Nocardioides sp. YIM 152315]|uniref:LLM class flavin-dependent oxidoreductase n=1 Tax=Nocardioides sp. YIM 152315 TaxID=3031760 RepID=UPI0023DCCED9|nr:LLM class flavin-dependent oxidoreductase [Nocardioides sp. YIM 152315]MDF1604963.1 LLM class flavin-dependent oxidoreductase [Nocardioides sp. YIM 152315]